MDLHLGDLKKKSLMEREGMISKDRKNVGGPLPDKNTANAWSLRANDLHSHTLQTFIKYTQKCQDCDSGNIKMDKIHITVSSCS